MAKEKTTFSDVVDVINLTSTVASTSANTEKTMDLSSFKNKDMLKSTDKILLKNKLKFKK